tara:strand:- start:975 stop:1154 length:180 start_codon:yes stop_codon:yes gene_type:complete
MNKNRMTIKKLDYEYKVCVYINNKLNENLSYYTDCKEDARETREAMLNSDHWNRINNEN